MFLNIQDIPLPKIEDIAENIHGEECFQKFLEKKASYKFSRNSRKKYPQ